MCETLVSQLSVRIATASLLAVLTDDLAELVEQVRVVLLEKFNICGQLVVHAAPDSRNGLVAALVLSFSCDQSIFSAFWNC